MKGGVESVVWHEGLLLTPQHLQQSDRYFQSVISNVMLAVPYFWGIDHLKINESTLPTGVFSVDEISGCFQDGLLFSYKSPDNLTALSVDLSKLQDGYHQIIYLTIPTEGPDGVIRQEDSARFSSYNKETVDLITGESADAISFLKPNLSLVVGDQFFNSKMYIPIAKVVVQNNLYNLSNYVYPTWNIIGTEIFSETQNLLRILQEKAQLISAESSTSGTIYRYSSQILFLALCSSIALIKSKLCSPTINPFDLYCVLSQAVGSINAALGKSPTSLPDYNHSDLNGCILGLNAIILNELAVISSKHSTILFEKGEDYYDVSLDSSKDKDLILVGIKVNHREYVEEVKTWFLGCPIFSESFSEQIKKNRISGIKRKQVSGNSKYDVSEAPTTVLFELSCSDSYFIKEEKFAILRPPEQIEKVIQGIFLFILT